MGKNSCYTYFKIVGKFDVDEVVENIGLEPFWVSRIGDEIHNIGPAQNATCCFCRCDDYDVYVENQMRETVKPLLCKKDYLKKLYKENDVRFFLEVVPRAWIDESTPCLAPPLDIIDFCHETRTEIDIDLYIIGESKKENV